MTKLYRRYSFYFKNGMAETFQLLDKDTCEELAIPGAGQCFVITEDKTTTRIKMREVAYWRYTEVNVELPNATPSDVPATEVKELNLI